MFRKPCWPSSDGILILVVDRIQYQTIISVRGDVLVMLTGIDESTAMKFTLQFLAGHPPTSIFTARRQSESRAAFYAGDRHSSHNRSPYCLLPYR